MAMVTDTEVRGMWVAPDTYRVTHNVTGRSIDLIIPGSKFLGKNELNELIDWQTESSMGELRQGLPPQWTKDQQHDLGGVLMDIKASKRARRERLHGRWY